MAKIQTLRDDTLEKVFLHNSLDAIYISVTSETSILTSDGKIKAELLDVSVGVANGTASGIVYNADTSRLTITNGGLQVNVQTNIGTASTTAEKAKVPTAGAVQSYISSANVIPTSAVNGLSTAITNGASTYVHSANVIPTTAVSNFTTAAKNAASTYVNSSNVIPTSAVNGLSTALNNAASTYVHSSGVIPVSAVTDLGFISSTYVPLAENGWTHDVSAGAGVTVTTNSNNFPERDVTVALKDYDTIETATTGSTVTIAPGKAYRIDATTGSKTLAISSFDAGLWGRESHIELFVANAGYIHVGDNVDLVDALEPDAVNNCTVRFHDGHAIISVEDHVGAYMVNNTSTSSSTSGTLAYGLKQTATASSYIGFRSELNTSSVPTGGATATVMKHIVGNGMDVGPTISGNLIISSGATIRDIKTSGLVIMSGNATLTNVTCSSLAVSTGGTATLGDVYIPSGSTVTASGGIYVEKATIDGVLEKTSGNIFISRCVVNGTVQNGSSGKIFAFSNSPIMISGSGTIIGMPNSANTSGGTIEFQQTYNYVSDVTISGGRCTSSGDTFGGNLAALGSTTVNLENVTIAGGTATYGGGIGHGGTNNNSGTWNISNCILSGNLATYRGGAIGTYYAATFNLTGCTISGNIANNSYAGICASHGTRKSTVNFVDCNIAAGQNCLANYVTFGGSSYVGAQIQGGNITLSSGATIDLTGNTNTTVLSGSVVFAADGASVIYDHDSTGAALGSSGTATIAGGTFSQLANGGTIITDTLGGSGSYDGVKLKSISSNTTINAYTGGNKVFRNCTFYDRISISSTNSAMQVSLTIGGTITAKHFAGVAISLGSSSASRVVVTIEPNTTIDATSIATSYPNIIWTVATLIVGSGVTVVNNGTSVAVTAGTYSNVSLKKDGSIVAI